ncbi:MAG TPA: hypothetical protein VFM13_08295 [Gaiellaceae bacterium]|nr:hypothetical protein [Gaiellaceae bacterium]
MNRSALLVSLSSLVLMLALPGTAAADQPSVSTVPISFARIDAGLSRACGFPVFITADGERRITTFADGRVMTHRQVTNTWSANGKTVTNYQTVTFIDEAGVRTVVGNLFSIRIPGQGLIVQNMGRVVFDVATGEVLFEAGPHEALSAICAYLGP